MPDNVAASMTASIVLDKSDLLAQILKGLSEGQKELQNNKLEMYFDFSNSKNQAEFEKVIQKYRKQLSSQEFVVQIKDQGIDETVKSLDKLLEVVRSLASGKAFGTGSGNGKGISNSIVDEKQLQTVINLFEKMESHLGSMRKVISDVGDGNEFSPLLNMINKVDSSISELVKKTSSLSLNMNLDFGSDDKMTAEVQSRTAKLLHTYENLFNRLKMSGTLDSNMQGYFDNFDINQYDNMNAKIAAYKNFITEMREMSKQQFGKDYLYSDIEKSYYSAVSGAQRSLNNAIKSESTSNNSIENLFGKTDLSEVISQLTIIINKLDEISTSANNFTNVFKNGLDVNTSIQEVIDLTNRVKELETELAKIKNVTPATASPASETNILPASTPVIEQQNKLQEELKETQQQAENATKAILKVTGYRGTNGGDPVTSNKSGATFWDSKKNVANMYGTNSSDKTLWSSELSFNNPFTFDAKKQKYGDITYLGDGADYASKEIIELTQRENELRKALDNSTKSGLEEVKMAYELQDVCQRIAKISKDTSNPYGTHSTDWFAEYAKNNGYDGVAIKNVLDTPDSYAKNGTEVSDVYITFQREQLQNTTLLAKANHELAESEREVALAELGVTQNKTDSSKNSLEDKIKSIFTDAKELKQILESLYNGKYFSFDTSENDDALGRVRELQKILEDYGYKIKNFKDDSEAFCVSGVISSLEEENNVLDKNTKKIKENQQMRSQNQTKDAFPDRDVSASIESATNSIKEENNVLEQNTQKVKENTQAKEQNANANLNKYDKRLDSYNGKVDKYQATIDRFNDGGWTSKTYLENVQAVRDAVKQYATLLDNIKTNQDGIASDEDIQNLDKYEKKIKDTIATVTNMSASEKGYNFVSGQKELDKIHKLLAENSKMSAEAKTKIKAYYAEIESGNPSMSLDKIHGEILKIYNAEVEAGRAGRTLWDTLKNSRFHQIAAQMAGMFGIYDIINLGKEGFNVVRELNTALTEMRKVSDESLQSLKNYQKQSFDTGDAIATTGLQLQNSTADWQRLGYSISEANELAKNSNIYKNVGDMDISTATEHMVSSVQAWKSEFNDDAVKTSEEVMNRYNKIGNEFAISSADIGEAMETSAAALKAGGNDLNEALGIITAGNIIQQDASTTSSAMKILSLRIRGAKSDLESMGESTDDLADSTSKLREEIKGLTGVDIMADEDTFKSTAEIIKEIGAVWDQMTDVSQAATLEKLAGKNRASTVAGLIENYETIDKVIKAASNADNSALDENQKIIDSIDGKIQKLQNRVQEFWYNAIDDSSVKTAVSILTSLVGTGTKLVDIFGVMPPIIASIFSFIGKDKSQQRFCPSW